MYDTHTPIRPLASFYIRHAVDLIYISLLTSQQIFNEYEWPSVSHVTCYVTRVSGYCLQFDLDCLSFAPVDTANI